MLRDLRGLRNAAASSWPCSSTDACILGLAPRTFPITSSSSLIPTVAAFRSSSSLQLVIRRTRLSTVGDRAFPVAGSRLWNTLPPDVTSAPTLTAFKTSLFSIVFSGRELTFTFAICHRPSVCRLSVCNVDAPYSAGCNFRQLFFIIRQGL